MKLISSLLGSLYQNLCQRHNDWQNTNNQIWNKNKSNKEALNHELKRIQAGTFNSNLKDKNEMTN